MRFVLSDQQRDLRAALATLLQRYAGPARMRDLGGAEPAYDHELSAELEASGFTRCLQNADTGSLEAALVVETIAHALGVTTAGATCLIAAATLDEVPSGPIAVVRSGTGGPARYAADATTILIVGPDEVRVLDAEGDGERVRSAYGYPMGRPSTADGRPLPGVLPERVLSWWRLALAVELVGTMTGALEQTIRYVGERHQFGRPIGSFQALQHRLAESLLLVEGSRWLALEAAWTGVPAEGAAAALAHAVIAGRRVLTETHQCAGAMGFTTEFDLHLWSMRIPALVREAESLSSPGQAVAAARWALSAP